MALDTLYVSEPDCELSRSGRWLRLERNGNCLARAAPSRLGHVMLFGEVALHPGAVGLLLRHAVPVSFLDRRGHYLGRLSPPDPYTPSLRQAQYRLAADPAYSMTLARTLVGRKIATGRQLLLRQTRNYPDAHLTTPLLALDDLAEHLADCPCINSLRGLEGRAAAVYFDAFQSLLRQPSGFTKRTRRPPRDPVNALLSFGYSILHCEINGQVAAVGLDPQVGFLHVSRAGRPALALDLIEEFRAPVVDRLVLRCWNLGILDLDDFTADDARGPWLKQDARQRFLREYERRMNKPFRHVRGFWTSCRRLLHGQARAVAHCIRHNEDYRGLPVRL